MPGAGAVFTAPAATDAAAATAATPGAPAPTTPPPPRAPRAPASTTPPPPRAPRAPASARAAAPEPPTPTAEEAIERRFAREAAAPPAPLRAVGDDDGHVDVEVEVVESFGPADDVGSALTVDEPWSGYDGQPASAIASRVRGADSATKAVVRLYEQQHKKRATVLRATG
jgi:hypothetical protein